MRLKWTGNKLRLIYEVQCYEVPYHELGVQFVGNLYKLCKKLCNLQIVKTFNSLQIAQTIANGKGQCQKGNKFDTLLPASLSD